MRLLRGNPVVGAGSSLRLPVNTSIAMSPETIAPEFQQQSSCYAIL
jgi:hypothetical protein